MQGGNESLSTHQDEGPGQHARTGLLGGGGGGCQEGRPGHRPPRGPGLRRSHRQPRGRGQASERSPSCPWSPAQPSPFRRSRPRQWRSFTNLRPLSSVWRSLTTGDSPPPRNQGGGCQEDLWKTVNFDGSDMGFAGAVKEQCARCADAAAASRTGARWPQGVRPTSLEMNANSLRRASDVRAQ